MRRATEFEILRGLTANAQIKIDLPRNPVVVATLIDEQLFMKDQLLEHNKSIFLEDRHHDYVWDNGIFRYFTRVALKADVLVVYALETWDPNQAPDVVLSNQPQRPS